MSQASDLASASGSAVPLPLRASALVVLLASVAAVIGGAHALVLLVLAITIALGWLGVLARPERALLVYVIGLPTYVMTLVVLYGVLGAPPVIIRLAQLWKELLLLTVLAGLLIRHGIRAPQIRLSGVDWLVLSFVLLNLLYTFFPIGETSALSRLASARTNLVFGAFYVAGRLTVLSPADDRLLIRVLTGLALLTLCFVAAERVLLNDDWPLRLGYSRFFLDFYDASGIHSPDELPWSFWTEAKIFRRPSAFFANPLDMAAGLLLLIGTTAASYLRARERRDSAAGWLLLTVGLCLVLATSLTRMAIITLPFILAAIAVARGKRSLAAGVLVAAFVTGLTVAALSGPLIQQYLRATLFFEDSSSVGHLEEWRDALQSLVTHPFGRGLGTSGAAAARTGRAIGGENQYLIYGVQLGWLGLLLYGALVATAIRQAMAALRESGRSIFGTATAAAIALCFLGITSEIGIFLFVVYVGWWLIGYATTVRLTAPPLARVARAGEG